MRACVRACVRACARSCMRACVRVYVRDCTQTDFGVSVRHSCQKQKWESTAENGQQGKRSHRSSFSLKTKNRKPQDLIVYSDGSFTKRPVRMELQCQARCEHQPRRQCSHEVSNFSSTMEVEAVTHAFHWFAPRQSDHTCHHPHRFNELAATKSEMWNGKPSLECVNGRYSPPKTPVGVLPWTCRCDA